MAKCCPWVQTPERTTKQIIETDASLDQLPTFVRLFADEVAMSGSPHRAELAAEADFRLGGLLISPSACKVASSGEDMRVEPRVMEVLVVLWHSAGQTVTRDRLIEACWEGREVTDDAVNRVIAKVRQLGRSGHQPHFAIETVSKIGFRLIPPGGAHAKKPKGGEDAALVSGVLAKSRLLFARFPSGSTAWTGAAVTIALGLAATLAWLLLVQPPQGTANGSVVLASFEAVDASPESARLGRRLPTTLQKVLAGSGVLLAIGDADAEFSVSGAIERERENDVIRVSVTAREGAHTLWSGRYERGIDEPTGLDQEVAARVASIMLCALEERKAAKKPFGNEVLSLLFYACDGDAEIQATRRLVEKAPDLAGAHALLALDLASQAEMETLPLGDRTLLAAQAHASVDRALRLDPNHAVAHAVRGIRLGAPPLSLVERESHLRRALELRPGLMLASIRYAVLLRETGRLKAAWAVADRTATSPRAAGILIHHAFVSAQLGWLDQAHGAVDRLEVFNPRVARSIRLTIAQWWDDSKEMRQFRESGRLNACFEAHFSAMDVAKGKPVVGLPDSCGGLSADWRVRMLARQGDIDGAYDAVAKPADYERTHWFLFYPEMRAFRRDPRFMPLTARLGLLRYWRETNQWPDFCYEPDLPYDCRAYGARAAAD